MEKGIKLGRKTVRWNEESIIEHLKNIGYSYLGKKYIDKGYQNQLWVNLKCDNENHESYWTCWNNFIKGYLCNSCYLEKNDIISWDEQKVIDFYAKYGLTICDVSKWKDVDTRIRCTNNDGYFVWPSITSIRHSKHVERSYVLKNLFGYNPDAIENIKMFCENERPDYKLVSDKYVDIKKKLRFRYLGYGLPNDVDRNFETTLDCFFNGRVQHPMLTMSKAETKTKNFLEKKKIKYIFQYTNKYCINPETNTKLRFDYAILDENENLFCLLELDGQGHDTSVEYWGGDDGLKYNIRKDNYKNEYCERNEIYLVRIHYPDFKKIEEILSFELSYLLQ